MARRQLEPFVEVAATCCPSCGGAGVLPAKTGPLPKCKTCNGLGTLDEPVFSDSSAEATLRERVGRFLKAHDRFGTVADYSVIYGTQEDEALHYDEMNEIAKLRALVTERPRRTGKRQNKS